MPQLPEYIQRYLFDHLNPDGEIAGMEADTELLPEIDSNLHVNVYHNATTIFHAPSDLSGIGGMQREIIRACPSWQNGPPRHDCVLVENDPSETGFLGLQVAQVVLFLSFEYDNEQHEVALVHWFDTYKDVPCPVTGMWRVQPHDHRVSRRRLVSIIHIDTIYRSCHLIPVFGGKGSRVPLDWHPSRSLLDYRMFYVNKYIDYHAHETIY